MVKKQRKKIEKKQRLPKKKKKKKEARERYQNLSEKKRKKSGNMVANDIKTFLNMKNKDWMSMEKNIKCGKIKTLHNKTFVLKLLVDLSFWLAVLDFFL